MTSDETRPDQPTPRAPGRELTLMTEPYDGHGDDETCPGCPHVAPEPSAPDDLQERLDRLYAGALRKHESCRCPIGLAIRADYAAVMDVLRRNGLVT